MDYSLLVGVKKERFEVMTSDTPSHESDKLALGSRDSMATISAPHGRITDHALGRSLSTLNRPTVGSMMPMKDSQNSTPNCKPCSNILTFDNLSFIDLLYNHNFYFFSVFFTVCFSFFFYFYIL